MRFIEFDMIVFGNCGLVFCLYNIDDNIVKHDLWMHILIWKKCKFFKKAKYWWYYIFFRIIYMLSINMRRLSQTLSTNVISGVLGIIVTSATPQSRNEIFGVHRVSKIISFSAISFRDNINIYINEFLVRDMRILSEFFPCLISALSSADA